MVVLPLTVLSLVKLPAGIDNISKLILLYLWSNT
jgi:hypothetical protein